MGLGLNRWLGSALGVALALTWAAHAQSPPDLPPAPVIASSAAALPAFAVVSIKRFRPTGPWHRPAQFDPKRLYIEGMAPVELINLAYGLNTNQLTGLPAWGQFSIDHLYQITAVSAHPATPAQMLLMLRRVLAERFHLVLSESNQVQPVFLLEVAPGGPKLTPLPPGEDCQKALNALPRPQRQVSIPIVACTVPDLTKHLNTFAKWLVPLPVLDKTGLTGSYVMRVVQQLSGVTPVMQDGKQVGERWAHQETVATALPRELGLQLVKAQAPYPMLKVVHIAPPEIE